MGFGRRRVGIGVNRRATYPPGMDSLGRVTAEIVDCFKCPRLVNHRERVAIEKKAAYRNEQYWGRAVPGFGDPDATLLIVGLAPGAHGANRTGRVFTGDPSGDWLFRALHRAGYANQPTSKRSGDGLRLTGAYVSAAVRCAPPDNKPSPQEQDACRPYLEREVALLPNVRVVVALGAIGYRAVAVLFGIRPRPKFGHLVEVPVGDGRTIICSFHPSQQNTFTGKLTDEMFDAVFQRARAITSTTR